MLLRVTNMDFWFQSTVWTGSNQWQHPDVVCVLKAWIQWNLANMLTEPKGTHGFQCSLEILYRLPNIIGRILSMFSSMRLRMYSLFQKYRALSATCQNSDTTLPIWRIHYRHFSHSQRKQSLTTTAWWCCRHSWVRWYTWSKRQWIIYFSLFLAWFVL